MRIAYFGMLGVFCSVLGAAAVYAETPEAALAKENIHPVAVAAYKDCPAGHYPSKYLDNIYKGTYCYQCINGTTWHAAAHKCL